MRNLFYTLFIILGITSPVYSTSLFMELARLEVLEETCKVSIEPSIKNQIRIELLSSNPDISLSDIDGTIAVLKDSIKVALVSPRFLKEWQFCEILSGRNV